MKKTGYKNLVRLSLYRESSRRFLVIFNKFSKCTYFLKYDDV